MPDCTVYVLDDISSVTSSELQAAIASLPDWRREQALKFKHEQGRKECALSYLLLCRMLREQLGISECPHFSYGEHGKPILAEHPHIHFNISHCKSAIACAVSDTEVGVDVEAAGRYSESLARYCMNYAELSQIQSAASPDAEFTRLWTQKEAVFKLTGTGINDDVKNILRAAAFVHTQDYLDSGFVLSVALTEKKVLNILKIEK